MVKKGMGVEEVEDVKEFLQTQVDNSKRTSNTPMLPGQQKGGANQAHGVKKVTDYKDLDKNYDMWRGWSLLIRNLIW